MRQESSVYGVLDSTVWRNLLAAMAILISVLLPCVAHSASDDWQNWSPRPEISPVFARQGDVLEIRSTGNPAIYGSWRQRLEGVKPESHYRLIAHYRADGLMDATYHATARLEWLDASGKRINPPDYAMETRSADGWTRVELLSPSPANAADAVIELNLRWSASGAIAWKDISLVEEPAPAKRLVRVATVGYRPRKTGSADASIAKFCELVRGMEGDADLVCLPEGASVIGTGKTYADVAEPIPGPLTQKLGEVAKEKRTYLVAGLYEREGECIYNTAILLDRDGRLAGKYRKTHLPKEEAEAGITPGSDYPVFDTDFGRLAILVCWDVQFPEPWRAVALKNAEIVALPIWGGNELLAKARAIENHVYLVSASYDMKSFIVDPTGAVLAEADKNNPLARAEVDLNRIHLQLPWLGNMKTCTWKERRQDLVAAPEPR